ncbi:phosphate ABC transporter substrate-binding protein PstS [Corynebacterium halotolerans]|uniref:Phosphate-binding protein n=1 Tax=Corynebacterium halotolerans YIM 70093 = DSM 44683 TaxID=1121362 RepID=M1P0Q3_9CORY|nr:phosphate ABC transporter substrate-binding protein PstS [Corynebacterium halotolerans]AGF73360.1 phosphate-binding protein [Corynebacterium halotolerans YIM 70093 = DSM 44683]
MIRNFKRTAAVLGIVAAGSAALVACGDESGNGSTETTASNGSGDASASGLSGTTGQLVGEGASSQQNAMDYFNIKYQEATGGDASLAYTPSGSGSGRTNFVGGQVDFAGSDSPLSEDQVEPAAERCGGNEAWHLPFVIGPVAIAYNLEGVDENLSLSIPTVAKIFNGEITNWNDETIAAENEGVELPDTEISVVYRSDESGTTDNFQQFLNTAAPDDWDTEGQNFPTEVGAGANGSNGVANEVAAINGGITYVESGFAQQQGLGIANLDFGSGPVELNAENVGTALDALEFQTEGHNMVVDTEALFAQNQEGSYPLVLTTYEIVCSAGYDEETSNMVKDFLTVALDSQDEDLEALGYIPVTGTHHERLTAAVEAIQ